MADQTFGTVYILLALMLVLSALISRRTSASRLLLMLLGWVAIFGAGFVLFTFRDDLGYVMQRLRSEATGEPVQESERIRIPMSVDGHFWVGGKINGEPVRFLIDSGATVTTIGEETARRAGIALQGRRRELVRTGNGIIRVTAARADRLAIGPVERNGVGVHVAANQDFAVLGMNFLSTLDRWGVEGRWLVLEP